MKTKYLILLTLLISCGSLSVKAQKSIQGFTYNIYTKLAIDSVKVVLIKDGLPIDSTYTTMVNVNTRKRPYFSFNNVSVGKYTIICTHPLYNPYIHELSINKQTAHVILDYFYLTPNNSRSDRMLKEAKVTATKIKLLHKGDTIVYNADAFNLAQGSMLEALINELPGVKIDNDGQIYVNGRKVDELLLNGKDFFRGDRMVLLENLPAYMVKNIKVYEKDDIFRNPNQRKPYAMDVILKKQYAQGWLTNTELAGGTNERYLGRLFGLRFTDHSRLSLYGNANNVNDNRKPGNSGDWNSTGRTWGKLRTQKGGFDLYAEDLMDYWTLNTSNEVIRTTQNLNYFDNQVTFLPSQNSYRQSETARLQDDITWSTSNWIMFFIGKNNRLIKPFSARIHFDMNYRTISKDARAEQATCNIPFDSTRLSLHDIINTTPMSQWFANILNRSENTLAEESYLLNMKATMYNNYQLSPNNFNSLSSTLQWEYHKQNTTSYLQNNIEYPADNSNNGDYLHQYTRSPLEDYTIHESFNFWKHINSVIIAPRAEYLHKYSSTDRNLFNLQRLDQWGIENNRNLTELPSTHDSLQLAQDAVNSYYSRTNDDNIVVALNMQQDKGFINDHYKLSFDFDFPLTFNYNRLHYIRNQMDAIETRKKAIFNPRMWAQITYKDNTQYSCSFSMNTTMPSLFYRLDVTDDVDPLNIQRGNPFLKNTTVYLVDASFSRSQLPHYGNFSTYFFYRRVENALAYSVLYDTKTGVRTTRPDNVNGNWNIYGNTGYNGCIDKKDRLSLSNTLQYGYLHNVDLTGTTAVERSVVHTVNLIDQLSLKYKIGQHNIGLKGYVSWSNISSDRENFTNMNVADFNYGLTALLQLPWKLQFSTDLTMYSRRGYESSSMNTNDLVWNARLSRTFLGGSLTCFVDGFDLLGNLSNVNRTVNAQGRTETRYNVVPRYAMLHVIYRLNKQPKKKNQ